jgi:hypothetical protein
MSAAIIPFGQRLSRRIAICCACGGHYRAAAAHHTLCGRCYRWSVLIQRSQASADAYRALKAAGDL